METFRGYDELREWLVENGFRILPHNRGADIACNWFAVRGTELPARECETNGGTPIEIIVHPYQAFGIEHANAEVELFGMVGGLWFSLNCYNLNQDVLPEKLDDIERMLVLAWNALERRDMSQASDLQDTIIDLIRARQKEGGVTYADILGALDAAKVLIESEFAAKAINMEVKNGRTKH